MAALLPRVVIVTRATELTLLVAEHGTLEQARFALHERGGDVTTLIERDRLQRLAVTTVVDAIPSAWRRARIGRDDLSTFPFEPDDVVVAIGQDGLVPNVAKYLRTQLVLGVNPDPASYAGILVPHHAGDARELIASAISQRVDVVERTMVEARLDDGQTVRALNEIFVGHRSHQSAKYRLSAGGAEERQSSSGFIVATGTGSTGWAHSIARGRSDLPTHPDPVAKALVLYVREAFPAPGYGTTLTAAAITDMPAAAVSEMSDGGVIFGDGIEDDFVRFAWGRRVEIGPSAHGLRFIA